LKEKPCKYKPNKMDYRREKLLLYVTNGSEDTLITNTGVYEEFIAE